MGLLANDTRIGIGGLCKIICIQGALLSDVMGVRGGGTRTAGATEQPPI